MSLYLTYRPQDFQSLVGQDFIRDTLSQAIIQNKTVGAYLFTGPRGTGKTSTARIFAKAINCTDFHGGNPCGKCQLCTAFQENRLIDVIEIDAASFTGVDNIREIIEKAQFQPTQARYKIYIIDEVHMLSKGAFNALLKILEEPPNHVKFILATTEIQKVPETILSRCQRYDFRSIDTESMRLRLEFICEKEKIKFDTESIDYIIEQARGGLRNALTLLEQFVREQTLDFQRIKDQLGMGSEQEKYNIIDKMISCDTTLFGDFDMWQKQGKNIKLLFIDILHLLQSDIEQKLLKGENFSRQLEVMEILHASFLTLKSSFDEIFTLKTALIQIVSCSAQRNMVQVQKIDTPTVAPSLHKISQAESPNEIKPSSPEKEYQPLEAQEVEDIFSLPPQEEKSMFQTPEKKAAEQSFPKEDFIKKLKELGAKAAVTLSLKPARFEIQENNILIDACTKVARETLQKAENSELFYKALEALDLPYTHIKIN